MSRITIADFVTAERILPRLRVRDKRHALRNLAGFAADAARLAADDVLAAVLAREEAMSSGLGRGVAIPHAMADGIEAPVGVFARLEPAVDFGAADGEPVDLVLLLVAPAGEAGALLRALACAARRLRDRDVRSRLRSASCAEALRAVLADDDWREPAESSPIARREETTARWAADLTMGPKCISFTSPC